IYLAYSADESEPTEVFHNDLRGRFNRGDPDVVQAMRRFAELAEEARAALLARDARELHRLVNANFDLRRSIAVLPPGQVQMVEVARSTGASAKFAGSGGAILGTYEDEAMFRDLVRALGEVGCWVI